MKVIKSSPVNINKTVIGRITKEPLSRFKRHDLIFATNNLNVKHAGYVGLITDNYCSDSTLRRLNNIPLCHSVTELDYLNNGDIVSLDENGNICVLYSKDSFHNAILVTEECNTNCIMCPQPRKKDKESRSTKTQKMRCSICILYHTSLPFYRFASRPAEIHILTRGTKAG